MDLNLNIDFDIKNIESQFNTIFKEIDNINKKIDNTNKKIDILINNKDNNLHDINNLQDNNKIVKYKNNKIKVGVFISIPKCASKTILEMFELGKNRDWDALYGENHFIMYENHQRLKVLEELYDLSNMYIFTFVRNPYDRIKSWFYYHKNIKNLNFYKHKSLNEWISGGCKTHVFKQNGTDWNKENKSVLLQYNYIEGKSKIDFIGKIENFENDCKEIILNLNNIFQKNNIPKKITYKDITNNTTDEKYKVEEITDENKELIYNLFKKDFEYFNYDK